jgi:hypothetical protein
LKPREKFHAWFCKRLQASLRFYHGPSKPGLMEENLMSDSTTGPAVVGSLPLFERHQPDWLALKDRVEKYRKGRTVNWRFPYVAEMGDGTLEDLPHFADQ